MREKVREFWIIDIDIGNGISLVKGTMLALSNKPDGSAYEKYKEEFIHVIEKSAYDNLAEINKVLVEAVEKCVAMEGLTFAECSDAEFIMETLRSALAKAKEMGK